MNNVLIPHLTRHYECCIAFLIEVINVYYLKVKKELDSFSMTSSDCLVKSILKCKITVFPIFKDWSVIDKKPKTPIRRMNCSFPLAYSIKLSAVESRTVYFIMTDPVNIVMYFISDCWYLLGSKCHIRHERHSMLLVYHASCN